MSKYVDTGNMNPALQLESHYKSINKFFFIVDLDCLHFYSMQRKLNKPNLETYRKQSESLYGGHYCNASIVERL